MTKYINYLLILFAFSLPFKAFTLNIIPELVFIMWLLEGDLSTKFHQLKRSKIFWILVGISTITLLSFLWSESIYNGYYGAKTSNGLLYWLGKYGYKLLIVPVLLTHTTKELFKKSISAFLLAMFIAEIVSYGIFFDIWDIGIGSPLNPVPFMHRTYYSTFLVFTVFILLILLQKEKNPKIKLFYILFALSATVNLFLNGGRTGQLAFVICSIYFVIHHYKLNFKTVTLMTLFFVSVFTLAYNFSPVFNNRMQDTKETLHKLSHNQMQTSFGQRVAIWIAASKLIKEHPLLGVGIGDSKKAIHDIQQKDYPDRPYINTLLHIHNQFMQIYLDSGIIGFVLLILIFYLLFKENFSHFDEYAKIFAIILLVLCSMDTPYHFSIGVSYMFFFIGLLFGYKNSINSKKL